MTTTPKLSDAAGAPPAERGETIVPAGAIRLKLAALGVDHRAADFPARFIEFCDQNDLYEMEVNASGELLILPMTGFRGNQEENFVNYFLTGWRLSHGGVSSSQTSRFRLASGEILGPDAAWINQERFEALTGDEWNRIVQGAPDFVVEIRSRTDSLPPLQDKMALWMEGGARLSWLIDAHNRQVYIYRSGQTEPEVLDDPEALDGEDVLPGFVFPVRQYIFDVAGPEE